MWYQHLKVTLAFVFLTLGLLLLIPVSILTGNYSKVSLNDTIDLYKDIANDIYSK
jgi:hypothetical protein